MKVQEFDLEYLEFRIKALESNIDYYEQKLDRLNNADQVLLKQIINVRRRIDSLKTERDNYRKVYVRFKISRKTRDLLEGVV